MRKPLTLLAFLFASPAPAEPLPLENSGFLVEEAWRADSITGQHSLDLDEDDWTYTWTEEWASPHDPHRFSFSVPVNLSEGSLGELSEISLNYAWQWGGGTHKGVALSPRFSLRLPLDSSLSHPGEIGVEAALPMTLHHGPRFASHWNARVAWDPGNDSQPAEVAFAAGMARAVGSHLIGVLEAEFSVHDEDGRWENTLTIAPGIRWRMEPLATLGILPGLALPVAITSDEHSVGLLFHMRFEHAY